MLTDPSQSLALILFLLPLAWSPGPGNLFFASLGAAAGLRASLPASLGYHLATLVVTGAIGLGAGVALSGRAGGVLAVAGGGYVLWLAWKLWHAGAVESAERARVAGLRDGAVLLLFNPKAYAIILAMFSQFLGPESRPAEVLSITLIFTLNNLVAFTVWTWAGDRLLQGWRSPARARMLGRANAVMLALVALWMMLR